MPSTSLNALKDIAKEVYSAAHPLIGTPEAKKVVGLGFGGDDTKLIDAVAEETVVKYLKRNHLSCTFIGEESGVQKIGQASGFFLIADSVDGTTNAVKGINFASTSLAISSTDHLADLEAAVVMNLGDSGIYEAERGKGARYNGKKIRPSGTKTLENAILSIDVSRTPEIVERVVPIMKAAKSVRSLGSAALEICYVASGLFEAYVDIRRKLRTVDIAAGVLILKEAGGVLLQPDGKEICDVPLTEMNRFSVVAAANNELCDEIFSLIKS